MKKKINEFWNELWLIGMMTMMMTATLTMTIYAMSSAGRTFFSICAPSISSQWIWHLSHYLMRMLIGKCKNFFSRLAACYLYIHFIGRLEYIYEFYNAQHDIEYDM